MPPVLEPHPQDGQRKLLYVFATIIGILVVIGIIASFLA
jgi:hypothetical protein